MNEDASSRRVYIQPVAATIAIPQPAEDVLGIFLANLKDWWPWRQHSVNGANCRSIVVEYRPGGSIYETDPHGGHHSWGRILELSPPRRAVFTWHPGQSPDQASRIVLDVMSAGPARSMLRLCHDHIEGLDVRNHYATFWNTVLRETFTPHVMQQRAARP